MNSHIFHQSVILLIIFATFSQNGDKITAKEKDPLTSVTPDGSRNPQNMNKENFQMEIVKILIVEDDVSLSQLYEIVLRKENYQVFRASNGVEAWNILEKECIDLVITDILMPVMDGFEFVRLLRDENPVLPILMITAREDFSAKNQGFDLGTDDCMTKPVDVNEMVLRVNALLRRAHIASQRKLTIRRTVLDYDSLTITCGGETFTLPQKEFFLLFKLLSYPNKIFTRIQLMDEIWGRNSDSDAQTIDVHINRLRRRFQDNEDFQIITVRGLGYKAVIQA